MKNEKICHHELKVNDIVQNDNEKIKSFKNDEIINETIGPPIIETNDEIIWPLGTDDFQ